MLLAQDIIILVVKYKHNIALINLRVWCKRSYLLIHILKLNPINDRQPSKAGILYFQNQVDVSCVCLSVSLPVCSKWDDVKNLGCPMLI